VRKKVQRFILEGPPGLGKSYCVSYMVWRILNDTDLRHRPIVYRSKESEFCYVFSDGKLRKDLRPLQSLPELQNSECFFFCDQHQRKESFEDVNAVIFYMTSPDVSRINSLKKMQEKQFLYAPSWSEREIEIARRQIYHDEFSEQRVKDLFRKWGGNARNIFQYAKTADDEEEELQSSLKELCEPEMLIKALKCKLPPRDVKSRFLQYEITPPFYFKRESVMLASQYIAEQAVEILGETREHDLLKLVIEHRGESRVRAGLGQIFEPIVHRRMKHFGLGTITVFDLDDPSQSCTVPLPSKPMRVVTISTNDDLKHLQPGDYGEPDKMNFPCIDAAVKLLNGTVVLFQITVGDKHPIKGTKLSELLALLPAQPFYPLVFVTCEGNDKLSSSQVFLGAEGKRILKVLPPRLGEVLQYVYKLPLVPRPIV